MKRILLIISAGLLSIPISFFGALYFVGDDVVTSHYKTYEEAKNDNLFNRGWLPDILPTTTKNFKAINNLDLNISNGSFWVPVADLNKFIMKMNKSAENTYIYAEVENGSKWIFNVNAENGQVKYELE